jgi:hypothetical protein
LKLLLPSEVETPKAVSDIDKSINNALMMHCHKTPKTVKGNFVISPSLELMLGSHKHDRNNLDY